MATCRPPTPTDLARRAFCCQSCAALALATAPWSALAAAAQLPEPVDARHVTDETRASLPKGTFKDYRKRGGFYLIADAAGIYAVTAVCTHNGCLVLLEEGKSFGCPCHDSEYDLQGAVVQGPAKLPLQHFFVAESRPGGPLIVDLSRTVAPHERL